MKEIDGSELVGAKEMLLRLQPRGAEIVGSVGELVKVESPSEDKAGVDAANRLAAKWIEAAGGKMKWHRQKHFGDVLEARFGRKAKGEPILLLGHLDTVWPMGTLMEMPFRVEKERVWGPGALDMKGGVVMALTAIQVLQEMGGLTRPVILLLNSDEEVGSPVSRPITEKLALECEAVYVLEPGQGLEGAYKTARKGVGQFRLDVTGVASHSGVDFEKGHSAVVELAGQVERVSEFTDLKRGLTVNPGVIGGGTRSNVIAAEAWAEVDVRIARGRDAAGIERKFRSLKVRDKACRIKVSGGINRPPMERTKGTVALFKKAQTLAAELGFALQEASTGGGSDGNFTSALGIPTLDGMGVVGEGAHARHESFLLEHLVPRTALLAAMLR